MPRTGPCNKIENEELVTVDHHWPRFVGKNDARDVHGQHNLTTVLRLITDRGALGWGVSDSKAGESLPHIMGKNVANLVNPEQGIAQGLNTYGDYPIKNGKISTSSKPGFGMKLFK